MVVGLRTRSLNKSDKKQGKPHLRELVFLTRFEKDTLRMKFVYMRIANVKECGQDEPWTSYARTP
jgi:hypothetical protein